LIPIEQAENNTMKKFSLGKGSTATHSLIWIYVARVGGCHTDPDARENQNGQSDWIRNAD
jgi:hypothetical protein